MKVLVIWRLLTVGGVNAGWRNRAIFFKKHGITTEFLYTTDHGGLHIMEDVAKVYLTKDKQEIVRIIKNNQYDAIIVVDTGDAYKWIKKAKYKGPVLVEARTPELMKLKPHLSPSYDIHPKAIIVPSNYQKRLVSIISEGVPIHVIYNGVDPAYMYPKLLTDEDLTIDPVIPTGKKIIGWIGRLDKRKNWPMLLEVAQKIKEQRDDVEFWVIGGAQSIGREDFRTAWQEQELTDMVKWFPVIPYQKMPTMYAKIRESGGCTLATTKTESFGNTFVESMICGVPVVASRMMPVTELVVDGETGLLFRGLNVDDAVRKLNMILDDEALQKRMSIAASQHAYDHFRIEVVASQYVQFLKEVMEQGRVNRHD